MKILSHWWSRIYWISLTAVAPSGGPTCGCSIRCCTAAIAAWRLVAPEFEFVRGELTDAAVRQDALAGMDAVVHLAAIVGDPACARQPDFARDVNLESSLALIEESRKGRRRPLHFCLDLQQLRTHEGPRPDYVDEDFRVESGIPLRGDKGGRRKALLQSHSEANWSPTPLRFATIFGVSHRACDLT